MSPFPLVVVSLAVVATVYFVLSTHTLITRADMPTSVRRSAAITRVLVWFIVAVGLWAYVAFFLLELTSNG
jgi:hypothetical protein